MPGFNRACFPEKIALKWFPSKSVAVKRFAPLLPLILLCLLAACHPTPKAVPPAPKPEPTLSTTTASVTLTASTPTETAATTVTVLSVPAPAPTPTPVVPEPVHTPEPLPPAPLLGPSPTPASSLQNGEIHGLTTPPAGVPSPVAPAKVVLRLLAPEGQISENFKRDFAAKLGVEVLVDTYSSNDEAVKKLSAESPAYSLALVSYRIVPHLIGEQKIAPLPPVPPTLAPAPKFTHHFYDRDNKYALPYAFSLAGMAVRAEVKAPPVQWSQLFSEANYKLATLPADSAFESSLLSKANLRNSSLAARNAAAAASDSNSAEPSPIQVDSIANLKKKFATQPGWRFILPGEGSVIFLYNVVTPAHAPFPDKTAVWLAAFLAPENMARLAEENYLGVTQPAAFKQLTPASTGDLAVYPRDAILDKCIFVRAGYRPIPAPSAAANAEAAP